MNPHPYQLRRVALRDFKSVGEASVELRPLTVVVGPNSAGKSTLLQSILAVTQAVRSGQRSTNFPLNGDLIRLGTFDETLNFRSQRSADGGMELAFDLVAPANRDDQLADRSGVLEQLRWHAYVRPVRTGEEHMSGFARLASLQIDVAEIASDAHDSGAREVLSCDITSLGDRNSDELADVPVVSQRAQLVGGPLEPVIATGRVSDREGMTTSPVDAVILSGGVPLLVLRRTRQFDRLAEIWWSVVWEVLEEYRARVRHRVMEEGTLSTPSLEAVDHAEADLGGLATLADGSHPIAVRAAITSRLVQLDDEAREQVAVSLLALGEPRFRDALRERFADASWLDQDVLIDHEGAAGDALWRASLTSRRFFQSGVEYLGPLREAPHALYEQSFSSTRLGKSGEYTAAVLQAERNTKVLMPKPDGDSERVSLGEALDYWLQRFGLADNARSEDLARLGITLKVRPLGADRDVDLTAVGVGVSQVLPVVVLCLLSEPGALVLIEQPELHLHPKLQSELADFLLLCARTDRQIIVETHSEHLVNRLRYRIAEDDTSQTHELIQLVFAESDNGSTSYRAWGLNEYGGLDNDWPEGFLDLTSKEAQRLVQQSLAKRRRARDTPS